MVEKVSQHVHCQICGKVIPITETLCSTECKEKYQTIVKRRKTLLYIMYAVIFFFIALILVQNFV
jgi:predicted nucleic acid-binding Zn ribbon protein